MGRKKNSAAIWRTRISVMRLFFLKTRNGTSTVTTWNAVFFFLATQRKKVLDYYANEYEKKMANQKQNLKN